LIAGLRHFVHLINYQRLNQTFSLGAGTTPKNKTYNVTYGGISQLINEVQEDQEIAIIIVLLGSLLTISDVIHQLNHHITTSGSFHIIDGVYTKSTKQIVLYGGHVGIFEWVCYLFLRKVL